MHVKQMLPRARERLATIGANAPMIEAADLIVETIMEREVVSCRPNDVLRDVWQILSARGLQHIPVVDEYRIPVGDRLCARRIAKIAGRSRG